MFNIFVQEVFPDFGIEYDEWWFYLQDYVH